MHHMIKRLIVLLMLLTGPAWAHPTGTVKQVSIHSAALAGNLVGDPADQTFTVYLPPSYETSTKRYPVVFLLHGYGDTNDAWIHHFNVPAMLDELIARHAIKEMIVVMPNAMNRFLGSFYANSPVTGHWEDFIAEEMVARVDHDFRTLARAESRGVAGLSMGGFGAIRLAMHRPDVFSVVYAMSPCCLDAVEDIGYGNSASWHGLLQFKTYADVDAAIKRGEFYPVAALALLSAIDPDPAAPLHVKMPMQEAGHELMPREPEYTEFRNQFPLQQVSRFRDNLCKLRALAISYGFNDQFAHIPPSTAAFSKALSDAHVPHLLDAYNGDHRQQAQARLATKVFPFLSDNLKD
jgi:S-formylglutathione hydrolase FrmB